VVVDTRAVVTSMANSSSKEVNSGEVSSSKQQLDGEGSSREAGAASNKLQVVMIRAVVMDSNKVQVAVGVNSSSSLSSRWARAMVASSREVRIITVAVLHRGATTHSARLDHMEVVMVLEAAVVVSSKEATVVVAAALEVVVVDTADKQFFNYLVHLRQLVVR